MSIFSEKLAHVQVIINCQHYVTQMSTREDTLAQCLGMSSMDDDMSHNELTTMLSNFIGICTGQIQSVFSNKIPINYILCPPHFQSQN